MIVKKQRRALIFLLPAFLLVCIVSAGSIPVAAESSSSTEVCPLGTNDIGTRLVASQFEGRVGLSVLVKLVMNPAKPPAGFYYSSLVEVLQAPKGPPPEVLTGVPEIAVKCFTPGSYLLRVRVNLIAKSSCGGAKATILMEKNLILNIKAKADFHAPLSLLKSSPCPNPKV